MFAYPPLTRKLLLDILLLSAVCCVWCLGVGMLLGFVGAFCWGVWFVCLQAWNIVLKLTFSVYPVM